MRTICLCKFFFFFFFFFFPQEGSGACQHPDRVYRDHVVCVEVFSHIFQDRQMIKPTYERQSFNMLHGPYKNFQR